MTEEELLAKRQENELRMMQKLHEPKINKRRSDRYLKQVKRLGKKKVNQMLKDDTYHQTMGKKKATKFRNLNQKRVNNINKKS